MNRLQKAFDLIKEFEGLHKVVGDEIHAYPDPAHGWLVATIGWGTTRYPNGVKVKQGDVITREAADELLLIEINEKANSIIGAIKQSFTLDQYCAMVSLAYNIGASGFKKSVVLEKFNQGLISECADAFLLYNKAKGKVLKGLTRRRQAEQNVFLGGNMGRFMSVKPKSKPTLKAEDVLKILKANKVTDKVCLVGVRGYYLDSMGAKGKNDRGVYDDAFFWVSPEGVISFNGNCDASKYRKGKGSGSEKGMASLNPGVWRYKTGIHYGANPHPAFRQAANVSITRDGTNGNYQDVLTTSINIHKGGANGTSSLGCQTVPSEQWAAFKELGYLLLKKYGLEKNFPYLLIEEENRRSGKLLV